MSYPPDPDSTHVSSASIAMAVMIYLYVIGYSASWGPVPWVYVSEIFPTRLRAYGVGSASATQWLFNFVITKITPAAISNIGWKTFIMFVSWIVNPVIHPEGSILIGQKQACFCFGMTIFVFFFIKETKGRSLEDMDILFGTIDPAQRQKDIEYALAEEKGVGDKGGHNAEHAENITVSK